MNSLEALKALSVGKTVTDGTYTYVYDQRSCGIKRTSLTGEATIMGASEFVKSNKEFNEQDV